LYERLEEAALGIRAQVNTGIGDTNDGLVFTFAFLFNQHDDLAPLGKFQGIANQIGEHLTKTARVPADGGRYVATNQRGQLNTGDKPAQRATACSPGRVREPWVIAARAECHRTSPRSGR
jgi:hypothetical protein